MTYSYDLNRAERYDDYKSTREFVLVLIDLVSRGGDLLLDIGPAADGTIPPLIEQRLFEIVDWLKSRFSSPKNPTRFTPSPSAGPASNSSSAMSTSPPAPPSRCSAFRAH